MLTLFETGGYGMFPTCFFGLLTLAAAAVFAVRPERRFVPLVVSTSLLTLATGALSFVSGVIVSLGAILDASDRSVALVGVAEAAHALALALGFVVVALMGASLGTLRIARGPSLPAPR